MDRQWARRNILADPEFREVSLFITGELNAIGISYCLIGGLAVAVHANPPVTVDIDFLVWADKYALNKLMYRFKKIAPWDSGPLRFGTKRPGISRVAIWIKREKPTHVEVDLIATGDDKYLPDVVARSRPVEIQPGFILPVATAEDIVILKTLAGREKDGYDVKALVMSPNLNLDHLYIDRVLDELEKLP